MKQFSQKIPQSEIEEIQSNNSNRQNNSSIKQQNKKTIQQVLTKQSLIIVILLIVILLIVILLIIIILQGIYLTKTISNQLEQSTNSSEIYFHEIKTMIKNIESKIQALKLPKPQNKPVEQQKQTNAPAFDGDDNKNRNNKYTKHSLTNKQQIYQQASYNLLKNFYLAPKINEASVVNVGSCTYDQKLINECGTNIMCFKNNEYLNPIDILALQQPAPIFDWIQSFGICNQPQYILIAYANELAKYANQGILINFATSQSNQCDSITEQSKKAIFDTLSQKGFQINQRITQKQLQNKYYALKYKALTSNQNGYFEGVKGLKQQHFYSPQLFMIITNLYKEEKVKTVADFGGGLCTYAQNLAEQGLQVECFDGNKATPNITKFGKVIDLTVPQDLGKTYDWVQSFEVGEHIPNQKSDIYIDIITKHASRGVIMSWAIPQQGGFNHINQKTNDQVVAMMQKRGFKYNSDKSLEYRKLFTKKIWFENTLMVFYKQQQ